MVRFVQVKQICHSHRFHTLWEPDSKSGIWEWRRKVLKVLFYSVFGLFFFVVVETNLLFYWCFFKLKLIKVLVAQQAPRLLTSRGIKLSASFCSGGSSGSSSLSRCKQVAPFQILPVCVYGPYVALRTKTEPSRAEPSGPGPTGRPVAWGRGGVAAAGDGKL